MAKILHLPNKSDTIAEFLAEVRDNCYSENVENILIALKTCDGRVMTGYFQCDFGTRLELVGHIQCDIIDQMILANLGERY
jgi:hypothetical protein